MIGNKVTKEIPTLFKSLKIQSLLKLLMPWVTLWIKH